MSKSSTAKVMDVVAEQETEFVLGGKTQNAIAEFAAAFLKSASVGAQCVHAALDVASDFPVWKKKSEAFKALTKGVVSALEVSGMKPGSAKGYASHFSNIVKVAQLDKVVFSVGKQGKKDVLKSCTGREFFLKHCGNFTDAYRAAKTFAKQYGLTNGMTGRPKGGKPKDKGEIVDMLDKVIDQARMNQEFAKSGLVEALTAARKIATGKKQATNVKQIDRLKQMAKRVELSRGQKAAATRRANQIKAQRAVEQARIIH